MRGRSAPTPRMALRKARIFRDFGQIPAIWPFPAAGPQHLAISSSPPPSSAPRLPHRARPGSAPRTPHGGSGARPPGASSPAEPLRRL